MSLKRLIRFRRTLAFRLTLWYAAVFTVSAALGFVFFYLLISSVMQDRTDQDLLGEVRTFSSILSAQGIQAVKRLAIVESQAAGEKKIFFRLLYPSGEAFSSSNMSYWRDIGISRGSLHQLLEDRRPVFETMDLAQRSHQVRVLYAILEPGILLQVGQSMESNVRIIEALRRIFLVTMAVLLVLAGLVGWFMARRALAGVEAVTWTARHISESTLDERVPIHRRHYEIDQLAITFNQMLDRIQVLVTGIKEMSDNIAHDLKSPITRIRGIAEVSLATDASPQDYENMAGSIVEECDRLLEMINTMLEISRTEAGATRLEMQDLDIARTVQEACSLFQSLAEDQGVRIACRRPETLQIRGDNRLIQRMIANLLDNAIKYNRPDGQIQVVLQPVGDQTIEISVADTGSGISAQDLPRIFSRFYRCDPSRSEPGAGLGLSLARAIARAHGGDISVTSRLAEGSTFTVILPRTQPRLTNIGGRSGSRHTEP
jgi:heavy metal sensor kinase